MTVSLKQNFANLKWWQATIMIVSILIASGFAAYMGANVSVTMNFEGRLYDVEQALWVPVNSSVSTLVKPCSYLIDQYVGASTYYLLWNGTTGKLDWYSTNKSLVIQAAVNNLTSGGTILLKEMQLPSNVTYGNNILIIENYQGTTQRYSSESKKVTVTVPIQNLSLTGLNLVKGKAYRVIFVLLSTPSSNEYYFDINGDATEANYHFTAYYRVWGSTPPNTIASQEGNTDDIGDSGSGAEPGEIYFIMDLIIMPSGHVYYSASNVGGVVSGSMEMETYGCIYDGGALTNITSLVVRSNHVASIDVGSWMQVYPSSS